MAAKTVIVTGASRGIGLAVAQYLISKSNNVVVVARSRQALENLRNGHPKQVRVLAGDLNDFSLAQQTVDLAIKEFGNLDAVVVNHGALIGLNRVVHCDLVQWREMLNINFLSAVAFAKAATPSLRKTRGCMVFTSSGAATGVYSAWGAYSASKAAINALARQIATEEPGITTIAVRPGVVDTDMQRELRDVHAANMEEKDNAKFRNAHQNQTLLKPEQPGFVMAKMALDPPKELSGQFVSWDSKDLEKYQEL